MGNFKVTKHNFYHFKYRALVLYVKAGDYFCSWDGGRGREGKKKLYGFALTNYVCDFWSFWWLVRIFPNGDLHDLYQHLVFYRQIENIFNNFHMTFKKERVKRIFCKLII